jgi:hypothetical protein
MIPPDLQGEESSNPEASASASSSVPDGTIKACPDMEEEQEVNGDLGCLQKPNNLRRQYYHDLPYL